MDKLLFCQMCTYLFFKKVFQVYSELNETYFDNSLVFVCMLKGDSAFLLLAYDW